MPVNTHSCRQYFHHLFREQRHLFFTAEEPSSGPRERPSGQQPSSPEQQKERHIQNLLHEASQAVDSAMSGVDGLPQAFQDRLRDNVAQFCQVSYEQYARRDIVEGMTAQEYREWKEDALTRINEVLSGIAGGAEQTERAQEEEERALKSLEEEVSDIQGGLESVEEEAFDLIENNLRDPVTIPQEIAKYQQRATSIQRQQADLSEKFQDALDVQKSYQKEIQGGVLNTVGGTAVIGATVGVAAATGWIPGVNLITLGAAAAVIAGAAAAKAMMRSREMERSRMANEALNTFKNSYNERRREFAASVGDMHGDGNALTTAPSLLRGQIEVNRESVREQFRTGEMEARQRQAEGGERLEEVFDTRDALLGQQQRLSQHRSQLFDARIQAVRSGQEVQTRAVDLQQNVSLVSDAITHIKQSGMLNSPSVDERVGNGMSIRERYNALLQTRTSVAEGLIAIEGGSQSVDEFLQRTQEMDAQLTAGGELVDRNLEMTVHAEVLLQSSVIALSDQITGLEETHEFVDREAAARLDVVNQLDAAIVEGVSNVALSNVQALGAVETQWLALKDMKVEVPAFMSSVANMLAAPINLAFKGIIGKGCEFLGKNIQIPVLSEAIRFVGGVSEAVGDVGTGLIKMLILLPAAVGGNEEGIAIVKGLGNLLAVGFTKESRKTYTGMGRALIAYEDWAKDGAKAAGKAVLNISLFFIPGVGQGAAWAGRAGNIVTKASYFVAGTAVGTVKSYASLPKNLVKGGTRFVHRRFMSRMGRLADDVTHYGQTAGAIENTLKGVRVGGQSIDEIACVSGRNLDDFAALPDNEFYEVCGLGPKPSFTDIRHAVRARMLLNQRASYLDRARAAQAALEEVDAGAAATETATATEAADGATTTRAPGVGQSFRDVWRKEWGKHREWVEGQTGMFGQDVGGTYIYPPLRVPIVAWKAGRAALGRVPGRLREVARSGLDTIRSARLPRLRRSVGETGTVPLTVRPSAGAALSLLFRAGRWFGRYVDGRAWYKPWTYPAYGTKGSVESLHAYDAARAAGYGRLRASAYALDTGVYNTPLIGHVYSIPRTPVVWLWRKGGNMLSPLGRLARLQRVRLRIDQINTRLADIDKSPIGPSLIMERRNLLRQRKLLVEKANRFSGQSSDVNVLGTRSVQSSPPPPRTAST